MQSEIQRKKNSFAVSIRRESRNNKIRELRNQYFQVIPQKYTYEGYIKYLDLDQNPQFTTKNAIQHPFILVRILLAKQDNFIRITFKNSSNPDMVDEKLLPPQNSQFELEDVPLPKQYPFVLQGALIQSITSEIEQDPQKYKQMPKEMQKQLIDFLLQYIKRNRYIEIAKQPEYHRVLINFLEYFVCIIESPDLRDRIIRWVTGTDGFKLISHCLPGTFMRCTKYFKLYNLILKGLRHNKMHVRYQAIHVLLKSIQGSDFDEIFEIMDKIPEVFKELINYFQKLDETDANQFFQDQPELYQSAREGGQCVVAFLDCYDEEIIKLMEEGAGYVGGWLIMQNDYHLIRIGLRIFNVILEAESQEMKSKGIQFLLHSGSVKNLEVWQRLGRTYEIVMHSKVEIRLQFIGLITRVIGNTELDCIKAINSIFQFPNNESLVEMLVTMFIQNEDLKIRYLILQCFQGICFYGDYINEQLCSNEYSEREKRNCETLSFDYLINRMASSGMINIMKEIEMKKNFDVEKKEQNYKNICEIIDLFFDFIDQRQEGYFQQLEKTSSLDSDFII